MRILSSTVWVFAGFTLLSNAVVFAGGSLRLLVAVSGILAAAALAVRVRYRPREEEDRLPLSYPLLAACLLCSGLTLVVHRPDLDDSFYVNLAVGAADRPGAPLLGSGTLHGMDDVPLHLPIYKVHSFEVLEGALAWLTGREVLDVAHLAVPAFLAFLVPLAIARVMRLLTPARWAWSTAAAIGVLVFVGDTHWAYGNFAFVRLHQGKAAFLAIGVPVLIAYALEYAKEPTRARWARLLAAQIACVGLSSTALWVAPVVTVLAVASGARSVRTVALGFASCVHPVLLALFLRGGTQRAMEEIRGPATLGENTSLMIDAWRGVFGGGAFAFLVPVALVLGWAAARSSPMRRFFLVFPVAFVVFLWNPLVAGLVAKNVTSVPAYWRVFWVLPVPILLGAFLTAGLEWFPKRPRWLPAVVTIAILASALLLAPRAYTFSAANRASIGVPSWKVPETEFALARTIAEHAPSGTSVLAPPSVAPWIPTLRGHPAPLVVRKHYLTAVRDRLGNAEIVDRLRLVDVVSGNDRPENLEARLFSAIRAYDLRAICIAPGAAEWPEVPGTLRAAGFDLVGSRAGYEVWAKVGR